MTAWLKVIGTSSDPLRNDWVAHAPSLLRVASFGKRPDEGSFVPGDLLVYYALRGDVSRVVAIGRVKDKAYYDQARDPGWPWLVPVEIEAMKDFISDGFPLDRFDVDRTLTRSVRRHSHIIMRPGELQLVRQAFGLA